MSVPTARPEVREVLLALVDEPALPSRSSMDEQKMDELTDSIRAIGFISILVLVAVGDRFQVVAGHRRSIAARRAGLVAVPALVFTSTDAALDAIQYAENRYREDLSAPDEAIWFAELLEKYPDDGTDGVAARVGEKRAYVEGRLALLSGDREIFAALERGEIRIGVAQELNRVDSQLYRRSLLDQAIRNGATVAIVSGWVAQYQRDLKPTFDSVAAAAGGPASPAPIVDDYFTCRVCGRKDNTANMRPVNVHDYCIESRLKPALEMEQRAGDYTRWPRTLDEARALINQLADRFPALAGE